MTIGNAGKPQTAVTWPAFESFAHAGWSTVKKNLVAIPLFFATG